MSSSIGGTIRVLIALGGNAMTAPDGSARPEDQRAAIEIAADPIAELIVAGHEIVLTHGNGPQVGNLLVKNEIAAPVVPPVPLDWCGAQTQATIGFLLLNALDGALSRRGSAVRSAALVSRTEVDPDDPGFADPAKPVGRYLPADEAAVMVSHGQQWQDRGPRGWRRVVASPAPVRCLDAPAALALLGAGFVVVCSGGGGVPTLVGEAGTRSGVEAVIDKDLTAALLAADIQADLLVIATDVPNVVAGWGTGDAHAVGSIGLSAFRALAAEEQFAAGSMGPKIEAVCRFVAGTGRPAVITSLARIADAVAGGAGTAIHADGAAAGTVRGEII